MVRETITNAFRDVRVLVILLIMTTAGTAFALNQFLRNWLIAVLFVVGAIGWGYIPKTISLLPALWAGVWFGTFFAAIAALYRYLYR